MKKRIIKLLLVVCLICSVALAVTACKGVKMTISFMVDGKEYATINTSGNEIVTIPQSPTKDDYTFDGWFWDDGTWQRPFTASSLLNEPLTSNMSVYAKFTEIHKHVLTLQPATKADCTHTGNDAYYTCTCGRLFADVQAQIELTAVPEIEKTGHTYSTEWEKNERGHWHVATCAHTNETTAIEKHVYDSNYVCKICYYQDTSLHGTEIATEVFDINGETLYAKMPNSRTTFSFINAIQVADGATFVVATDLAASNIIRTKTVSLEIGDNTYYILVENGNDIQLYTVMLRRRPIYTVTFATNGGMYCDSQQVEEDSLATKPTTSKTGYTFVNWDYDFTTPITQNTMITASWKANKYNVTYDVNGGILADTQYTAMYDSAYTLVVPTKEGHTFQGWYVDDTQITYANGQSRTNWTYTEDKTVTAKWAINSYNVSLDVKCFDSNGKASSISGTLYGVGMHQFGSQVKINVSIFDSGYNFLGWYDENNNLISKSKSYTFTVYSSVSYTAKFNYYTLTAYGYNNAKISVGTVVTLSAPMRLGLDWVGWYNGDELLTAKNTYTFTMPAQNLTYTDKWKKWDEMANYSFTSTSTTCTITGVIDKTISNIILPDYVTSIGDSAFVNCKNLTSITIPDSVKSIGGHAFVGCEITSVYYKGNISDWCMIDFQDCYMGDSMIVLAYSNPLRNGADLYVNNELITELIIPENINTIKNYAFAGCKSIKKVTIPNGVTSIGQSSFADCRNLMNVIISQSVIDINMYAFYNCYLPVFYCSAVNKPDGWNGVWNGRDCPVVWNYNNNDVANNGNIYIVIDGLRYSIKDGIATVTMQPQNTNFAKINETVSYKGIAYSVNSIDYRAFYGCSSLTSIIIPNSVTNIGSYTFSGCSNLTVYCEATSKPDAWQDNWSDGVKEVIWGYQQ